MNFEQGKKVLDELRLDCAIKQKKGLHFILASVVLWSAVFGVHVSNLDALTKNFYTFCITAILVPIAFLISKIIKVDFQNKENPLTNLGILFSVNQFLYLIIAMWVYQAVPDKMLMVIAMIFGAHLMPFGWLYQSKSYMVLSGIVTVIALFIGCSYDSYILAAVMIVIEIIFCISLVIENKKLSANHI
ncbi:DUF7010 family protein [Anaeromicropila herbilytica]|uniref:Uncharacterized protein n=1 Tax=Anaeromicropila herbilytica TaxID=2785025 RepID=A0A7R7IER6_9FIRM|nr:hypothetical protein [Anaeromicropila herbilytica]BCN32973.1 hypothetical protein bsdtb5_42680 [Anaeromicropila herbilytica]